MSLPNFDEVLKMGSKVPEYLKIKEKSFETSLNERNDLHYKLIKKPNQIEIEKNAIITKEALINKQAIDSIKEADQNYQNYIDFLELNQFSETMKEEKNNFIAINKNIDKSKSKKTYENEEDQEAKNIEMMTFDPDKPKSTKNIKKNRKYDMNKKKGSIKDKEMAKRMKGQSSIGSWKSETHMKLRQQYD